MLYNTTLKRNRNDIDCLACPYYDSKTKSCNGIGKVCFEIDQKTKTLIEPTTGLPLKYKEINNGETK